MQDWISVPWDQDLSLLSLLPRRPLCFEKASDPSAHTGASESFVFRHSFPGRGVVEGNLWHFPSGIPATVTGT